MSTPLAEREKTSLSVRIPKQLKSRALNLAKAQQVSVSTFVTALIEKAVNETDREGEDSAIIPSDINWRAQNERRIDLIVQERDHGLTVKEQTELVLLQDKASRHVNQILPLPFDALAEFEGHALRNADRG